MTRLRFCSIIVLMIFLQACSLVTSLNTPSITAVSVMATVVETPAAPSPTAKVVDELRPADSDTPAAGICAKPEGEIVEILLGSGVDGLPLGGRCIRVTAGQRLKLVNQQNAAVAMTFGPFEIDLAAGEGMLLDKPVGEYLVIGVHILPNAPEIWLVEP